MSTRQALSSDTEAVAALFDQYRVFYGKPSDPGLARSFIAERMRLHESVIFLAEAADAHKGKPNPAGFVQLYPSFSSMSAARIYVLNDLFVAQDHRRRGVAQQLMQAAQAFAHSAGAHAMCLSTDKGNHTAQALYESLGWERDHTYFYYGFTVPRAAPAAPEAQGIGP